MYTDFSNNHKKLPKSPPIPDGIGVYCFCREAIGIGSLGEKREVCRVKPFSFLPRVALPFYPKNKKSFGRRGGGFCPRKSKNLGSHFSSSPFEPKRKLSEGSPCRSATKKRNRVLAGSKLEQMCNLSIVQSEVFHYLCTRFIGGTRCLQPGWRNW